MLNISVEVNEALTHLADHIELGQQDSIHPLNVAIDVAAWLFNLL